MADELIVPEDTDKLAALAAKHGFDTEVVNDGLPSSESVVAAGAATEEVPVQGSGETATQTAAPTDAPLSGPARRVAEKQTRQQQEEELKTLRARIAELEGPASRVPELETRYNETKTLAEQREAELTAYREKWTNERSALDPTLLGEVPEVAKAQQDYNAAAAGLFPTDLANPADDEPRRAFNPQRLSGASSAKIRGLIDRWEKEEFVSQAPDKIRAAVQHVLVSHIAAELGVDTSKFQEITIGDTAHPVISTNHPVYRHIIEKLPGFVQARQNVDAASKRANEMVGESFGRVVSQRVDNSRKMFEAAGVGLTGERLNEALSKSPDNYLLQTMKVLEGDPELLTELKTNVDLEIAANGHFRPEFDIHDQDVKSYSSKAQALMTRIGLRAINAPMAPVMAKLIVKQHQALAAKDAELAKLREENDRTLRQAEAGVAPGSPTDGSGTSTSDNPHGLTERELASARRLGLLPS